MNRKNLILIITIVAIIIVLLLVGVTVFNGSDDDNLANKDNNGQKVEQGSNNVSVNNGDGKDEQYDSLKDLENDKDNKDKDLTNNVANNILDNISTVTNPNHNVPIYNGPTINKPEIIKPGNNDNNNNVVIMKEPKVSFSNDGSKALTPKFETHIMIRGTEDVKSVYWTIGNSGRVNVDSKLYNWKKCSYNEKVTLEDIKGTKYVWVKVTLKNGMVYGYSTQAINMRKYYDVTPVFNPPTVANVSSVSAEISFLNREDISAVYYTVESSKNVNKNANWMSMPADNKVTISSNKTENKYIWVKVVRVDGKVFYYSSEAYSLRTYVIPNVAFNSPAGVLSNRNIEVSATNTSDVKKLEYVIVDGAITADQYKNVNGWKTMSSNAVVENVSNVRGNVRMLVRYTLLDGKQGYSISDPYEMRVYNTEVGLVNSIPSTTVNNYTVDVKALSAENDIDSIEYYISNFRYTNQDVSSIQFTRAGVPTLIANENKTFYVWIKVKGKYSDIGTKIVCSDVINVRANVVPSITFDATSSSVGTSTNRVMTSEMIFNVSGLTDIIKAEYAITDFSVTDVADVSAWQGASIQNGKIVIKNSPNIVTTQNVFVKLTYGSDKVSAYVSASQTAYYTTAVTISCSAQATPDGKFQARPPIMGGNIDTRVYKVGISVALNLPQAMSDFEVVMIDKATGNTVYSSVLGASTTASIPYSAELENKSVNYSIVVRKVSNGDVIGTEDVTVMFPTHTSKS